MHDGDIHEVHEFLHNIENPSTASIYVFKAAKHPTNLSVHHIIKDLQFQLIEYGKMATYLKRTSKLFDISLTQSSVNINLRDLICPICRSILIEPVTLPCTHNLCLKCLKGTFEHNSLSCPLCRVRVGSWLRTATKTETLVNNVLWDLIQTKFSKEVEDKYSGDDKIIGLDADYSSANKILSTTGEIRKEYEVQLQMAQKEIQCQRKAEQIASEVLIKKIQEEEQQQRLAQLTQDELLAKSLVKKQIVEKQKKICNYNNSMNVPDSSFHTSKSNVGTMTDVNAGKIEPHSSKYEKPSFLEPQNSSGLRRTNIGLISKICAERYVSNVKNIVNASNVSNESGSKFCCQKPTAFYNAVPRTLKYQTTAKIIQSCISNCSLEPRTFTTKIYGAQSKEELHVPNDVVNSKKKNLGVEVHISSGDDDERMGSAESAGSHDSINQEIHHFKPIKAVPRTPLKISTDGRQIDPKLIRVVPILKRMSNVVPKPPTQAHLKRIIGCSWSAFRGKTKQSLKERVLDKEGIEQKPSTSCNQSQVTQNIVVKVQSRGNIPNLDFVPEVSLDLNESLNKIVNGTEISKKEHRDIRGAQKFWKSHTRNGMVCKSKRQRSLWTKKDIKVVTNVSDIETKNSTCSSILEKSNSLYDEEGKKVDEEQEVTMENIAERIKKRKINGMDKQSLRTATPADSNLEIIVSRRNTRKRLCRKDRDYQVIDSSVGMQRVNATKLNRTALPKVKQRRACPVKQASIECSEKSDTYSPLNCHGSNLNLRRTTRKMGYASSSKSHKLNTKRGSIDSIKCNSSESCSEAQECMSENNNTSETGAFMEKSILSDDEIVKEQEQMERLVIQEKEDFELAQRLQAKYDEMERIAGRTRRSKRAIESEIVELDLFKIDIGRNVQRAVSTHTAKSSIANRIVNTEAKKRGRPPKRVK